MSETANQLPAKVFLRCGSCFGCGAKGFGTTKPKPPGTPGYPLSHLEIDEQLIKDLSATGQEKGGGCKIYSMEITEDNIGWLNALKHRASILISKLTNKYNPSERGTPSIRAYSLPEEGNLNVTIGCIDEDGRLHQHDIQVGDQRKTMLSLPLPTTNG